MGSTRSHASAFMTRPNSVFAALATRVAALEKALEKAVEKAVATATRRFFSLMSALFRTFVSLFLAADAFLQTGEEVLHFPCNAVRRVQIVVDADERHDHLLVVLSCRHGLDDPVLEVSVSLPDLSLHAVTLHGTFEAAFRHTDEHLRCRLPFLPVGYHVDHSDRECRHGTALPSTEELLHGVSAAHTFALCERVVSLLLFTVCRFRLHSLQPVFLSTHRYIVICFLAYKTNKAYIAYKAYIANIAYPADIAYLAYLSRMPYLRTAHSSQP